MHVLCLVCSLQSQSNKQAACPGRAFGGGRTSWQYSLAWLEATTAWATGCPCVLCSPGLHPMTAGHRRWWLTVQLVGRTVGRHKQKA